MKLDLTALSNLTTDLVVDVTEEELSEIGAGKSDYSSRGIINSDKLSKIISGKNTHLCQGGSAGNVVLNTAKLGLNTCMLGTVGDDRFGNSYLGELNSRGIKYLINQVNGGSGICYILVKPDGERVIIANVGVSGDFGFDLDKIEETRLFHTTGYEIRTSPKRSMEVIDKEIELGAKISLDLAHPKMIIKERSRIERIIKNSEILFMTEEEAKELTKKDPLFALRQMAEVYPIVCLKKGSNGSIVRSKDEEYEIPIYPVNVVNTCGAGDAYASGFLFSYLRGLPLEECGHMGSYIASRVCGSKESHL